MTSLRAAGAALLVAVAVLVDAVPHAERRQRQHLRRPQKRRQPQQDDSRSPLLPLRCRLHGEQGRDAYHEIFLSSICGAQHLSVIHSQEEASKRVKTEIQFYTNSLKNPKFLK